MTVAEIMQQRFDGTITDKVALAELIKAGQTEAEAKELLQSQDGLLTDDVIEAPDNEK